ncbi:hypothetical protein C3941_00760 [Kaistia algarum]|uniref:hypothetical protein n=1 Tax=Kaistia algarum TaxID=2083279 RepID=UPI000CE726D2|nr:hypothetical protein [Kaistia algarum]MCX5513253.1 hypothetical protein [Kaistia algarum]PPE81286.1 hypothetical protein C3941_00760 [Kaistia algarum]
MNDSTACVRRDSSLNELLHEPIIAMLMTSDGVRSDEIRALFREVAEKGRVRDPMRSRTMELFERCFTP